MRIVEFSLPTAGGHATARGYLHDVSETMPVHAVRPCVVVCPGGGYNHCSEREKDPPALALFAAGYQVFTLSYSTGDLARDFRPLMELSLLIMKIREQHVQWQVEPDKIAVMGFSAGGHLAASIGTLWNHEALTCKLDTNGGQNRPNALVLCYPVITSGEHENPGSLQLVSGGDPSLRAFFALEKHVSADTPPTFLWHTADDATVPVENTLLFCEALRGHGIPFESHIFQHGKHGLSMCNAEVNSPNPACAPWFGLCLSWLGQVFGFEA